MISIVIPTYKEELAIGDTIRQFKDLTFPHEIIVGDGQSPDKTQELAHADGAIVMQTPDGVRSPAHQRNIGARAARGEYIIFIDATVQLPHIDAFVRHALKHFEDPRVVGLAVPQWIYPEIETRIDRVMLGFTNFILRLQTMGSGKFIMTRKASYDAIGGFRENLITREDGDFFIRLKKIGTVVFDPSLPIYYSGRREHAWGWPKLLWIWVRDTVSVILFDRSMSKEWGAIR